VKLDLAPGDLRPIVQAVVAETLSQRPDGILPAERLAFPEAEAAALCGVAKHVLRDARLRGEICGRLLGKKMIYERGELLRFLNARLQKNAAATLPGLRDGVGERYAPFYPLESKF